MAFDKRRRSLFLRKTGACLQADVRGSPQQEFERLLKGGGAGAAARRRQDESGCQLGTAPPPLPPAEVMKS